MERPSRRAPPPTPPPPSEAGRAGRLRAAFTRLAGLEETLSSCYHQIALTWFDHQIPITQAAERSIAVGTAAAGRPAGRIVVLERALGAAGCAAVEPPAG